MFYKHADLWQIIKENADLRTPEIANGLAKDAFDALKRCCAPNIQSLSGLDLQDAMHFLGVVARHLVMSWEPLPSMNVQPTTSLVSRHPPAQTRACRACSICFRDVRARSIMTSIREIAMVLFADAARAGCRSSDGGGEA